MALTSRTETTAVSRNGVGGEDRRRAHTVEEAAQAEEQHGGGGERECVEVVPSGRKHTGQQKDRRTAEYVSRAAWLAGVAAWSEARVVGIGLVGRVGSAGRQADGSAVGSPCASSPRPKRAGVAA